MKKLIFLMAAIAIFASCNQNEPTIKEPEIMSVANKTFYGEDISVWESYIQFKTDSVIWVTGIEERDIWRGTFHQHKDLVDCCLYSAVFLDTIMLYVGVFDGGVIVTGHFYRER